ncbi:MAG: exosortase A [Proteobacteria bacterium]|nr:exosortase A [Pseudomonadota bacterium]
MKSRLPAQWSAVLPALALLLAGVLWVYRDTAVAMVSIWYRSGTFAHAFTVPPIVAWLIWRQRRELAAQTPRPSAWALLPILCAALIWLLGDLAEANAVTQLAFTAMLVLAVLAVLGPAATRTMLFPLGFLFFAVPIGEFLLPYFMEWTADFTVIALRLSGIPVYREGLQFVIPSGNWSVVEACSGIRYLIASLMVGVLFAYLNYRSLRRRLIFVGVSILVPVVANWARAYLIVLLGHVSGNRLAVGADHLIYGWVFFGIVITLMFMIGARWTETATPESAAAPARPLPPAPGPVLWAVAAAACVLAFAPRLALSWVDAGDRAGAPKLALPDRLDDGWAASTQSIADWKPSFHGAAAETTRRYERHGQAVAVYAAYYRHQDDAHKLISSDNVLVPSRGSDWAQVEAGTRDLTTDDGRIVVRTAHLRGSSHPGEAATTRLLTRQLYWINGRWTASDGWAKAYGALLRLVGRGDDAAVIVIYAIDEPGADDRLDAFLRANLHALEADLARVRDGR